MKGGGGGWWGGGGVKHILRYLQKLMVMPEEYYSVIHWNDFSLNSSISAMVYT